MNGYVKNEGNVEAPVGKPFPISYRAIVPREDECTNLLVLSVWNLSSWFLASLLLRLPAMQ